MSMISRWVKRGVLGALATGITATAVTTSAQAPAQGNYPNRSVVIVNPWAAAGPAEALIRPIAERLSQRLGQPFVIETKPGANGTIGSTFVARAKPDGYTLLFAHVGPIAISPVMGQKPPYDSVKDFAPITQIASGPTVLVVRADFQARTLQDYFDFAKANPGKVSYGSVGPGSTTHIAGAMVAHMIGADMVHVPYKGSAPINTDLLGGAIGLRQHRGRYAAHQGWSSASHRHHHAQAPQHLPGHPDSARIAAGLRDQFLVWPDGTGRHPTRDRQSPLQ